MKYLRRGSGYYIDVGASDLVANGDVKLKNGAVDHLSEDAVVMEDGTELPADLVVFATGYGSMNGWAADLISPEVAAKVGKCWVSARTRRRTRARGRASSATCGSRRSRRRCGSTAATCTSHATTRSTSRCS
jgi:cation diffusion facilitator CzcD-associated flavoprotein CzcO